MVPVLFLISTACNAPPMVVFAPRRIISLAPPSVDVPVPTKIVSERVVRRSVSIKISPVFAPAIPVVFKSSSVPAPVLTTTRLLASVPISVAVKVTSPPAFTTVPDADWVIFVAAVTVTAPAAIISPRIRLPASVMVRAAAIPVAALSLSVTESVPPFIVEPTVVTPSTLSFNVLPLAPMTVTLLAVPLL